jgi:glycosyltransferase involved in cell wall biosynthesis
MSLYREVKRQAGVPVTIALWQHGDDAEIRAKREATGQGKGEYDDLELVPVGEDLEKGRALLAKHKGEGAVHVFCVYQVSRVWRQLIREAKESGSRVVVYAEAPCEMCVGVKAWLKRLYYRFVLPHRVGWVARFVDLFLCQSGENGIDRLVRMGWRRDRIVPFGYASAATGDFNHGKHGIHGNILRVLHTGVEAEYRGVGTLLRAGKILNRRGIKLDIVRTHGKLPAYEMERLYKWADVFVACGICEPWGMRVNDAIHAGLPVVVSSGMGAKMIVEQCGCGSVYKAGDAKALADALQRFAEDRAFAERCLDGVVKAHEAWSPENKANEFIKLISE